MTKLNSVCCCLTALIFCSILAACSPAPSTPEQILVLTPQLDQRNQTIHNFGASDAWSLQFVGKNWPVPKREQVADLLFSQKFKADGSPEGIALSAWRFNIGAGSADQGEASDIRLEWRRTESFLKPDGSMDFSRQAGQRWFLQAAKTRGVETFHGFSNSPPVSMTKNGIAHSSGGISTNLHPDKFAAYADFLVKVVEGLKAEEGIELNYLSPFNEPQWDWDDPKQEGTPWKNGEIAAVTRLLNQQLQERALPTKIEVPEAAQIQYLYEPYKSPERGDLIETFFCSAIRKLSG